MDFVVPAGPARLFLIEAKATRTLRPQMAQPIERLIRVIKRYKTAAAVVGLSSSLDSMTALRPQVQGLTADQLSLFLNK